MLVSPVLTTWRDGSVSDSAITIVMAGVVQIALGVVAYFSLRAKLKYSTEKAEEVAKDAMATVRKVDSAIKMVEGAVERADIVTEKSDAAAKLANKVAVVTTTKVNTLLTKIDDNTKLAEGIAKSINGYDGGPSKLEEINTYAHSIKHDLKNDINTLSLKLAEVSQKLDLNTEVTMDARVAAEAAAVKAEVAATKVENMLSTMRSLENK